MLGTTEHSSTRRPRDRAITKSGGGAKANSDTARGTSSRAPVPALALPPDVRSAGSDVRVEKASALSATSPGEGPQFPLIHHAEMRSSLRRRRVARVQTLGVMWTETMGVFTATKRVKKKILGRSVASLSL